MEKSWIKKRGGLPVVIRQFREADGEVDVATGGSAFTLPLEEWRALPPWDGPFPSAINDLNEVTKITVYQGTREEMDVGDVLLPRWRTQEAFERDKAIIPGLKILENTAVEIDANLLDSEGKTGLNFYPKHKYEIELLTTDTGFVEDMNSAGISGLKASYRATMAFDSAEHLCQIIVECLTAAAIKAGAEWIFHRSKQHPQRQIIINNKNVENSQIINVVNVYVQGEKSD